MFFFPDPQNRVIKLIRSDFECLPVQRQVKGRTKISSGEAKQKFNWQTDVSRSARLNIARITRHRCA